MVSKNWVFLCLLIICFSCKNKVELSNPIEENDKSNDALLDKVQEQTIRYITEGQEPKSGAARERIHLDNIYPQNDQDIVTSGGTGFGIMAIIVGIERGVITREEGYLHLLKLVNWLDKAERYHGAWSHWMKPDGTTQPFSKYDDGADLVETAYLAQGLLTARQYFKSGNTDETELAKKMDTLWKSIDWAFFTKGEDVLYWHWSPNYEWKMNFAVKGYNECLIMYVLAASSPDHAIKPSVFHNGFMRGGDIVTDKVMYDIPTILDHYDSDDAAVGPLFWAHYSYLGLDPHGLKDKYADYWLLNQNHANIHLQHAIINPNSFLGYSDKCWGMTSSYSMTGYAGHQPDNDLGVISPTAALSSFPYTPEASMRFLKYIYNEKDTLIGKYGPYDAFSLQEKWSLPRYLAIDQLPIPVMIENYRTGLIWKLFMSSPDVQEGLDKLGFEYVRKKL